MNNWYSVEMTLSGSNIQVDTLKTRDESFTRGSIGYGVNAMSRALLDDLSVSLLDCLSPSLSTDPLMELSASHIPIPPLCTRF